MFLLSKIFWAMAAPGNLLVLLAVAGVLWLVWSERRRGLVLVAISLAGLVVIAALPVGQLLLIPLEERFPAPVGMPDHIDGIVVLGGGFDERIASVRGTETANLVMGRLNAAAVLSRRYPGVRVVVSGGSGQLSPSSSTEAAAMAKFLVEAGVPEGQITREARSRNTYENAVFSYEEAKPKPSETWVLVTSAWHMPRAVGCFRRAGWRVIPFPVDFRTPGYPIFSSEPSLSDGLVPITLALKEWVGLVAYRAAGRTDALFPSAH